MFIDTRQGMQSLDHIEAKMFQNMTLEQRGMVNYHVPGGPTSVVKTLISGVKFFRVSDLRSGGTQILVRMKRDANKVVDLIYADARKANHDYCHQRRGKVSITTLATIAMASGLAFGIEV